jgi:hypothetical protein
MCIYTKKYPSGYYVYMYLRSRDSNSVSQGKKGTPYYVGKGCKYRAWERHTNVRTPKDHSNIIIIAQELTEQVALSIERVQIAMWGRINVQSGILRNKAEGGEGSAGFRHTEEMKTHFSVTRKGRAAPNKGKPASPETRARMKLAATLKDPPKESTKEKIRQTLTGRKRPPEVGAKISATQKGKPKQKGPKHSPEFKAMMGDLVRGSHYWNNGVDMKRSVECPGPGYVRGRLDKNEKYWNNGTIMKKSNQCPGEGWYLGMLKTQAQYWHNGSIMKKSAVCPGDGWVLGRLPNGQYWHNGIQTKKTVLCPGEGWVLGRHNRPKTQPK